MPHHRFGLWQQCPAGGLRGVALAAPPRQPAPNLRLPHAVRSHLLKLSQPCQGEAGNVTMHLASWQGEDCLWSRASAVHLLLNIVHEGKKKPPNAQPRLAESKGPAGPRIAVFGYLGAPRPGSSPQGWGQSRAGAAQPSLLHPKAAACEAPALRKGEDSALQ